MQGGKRESMARGEVFSGGRRVLRNSAGELTPFKVRPRRLASKTFRSMAHTHAATMGGTNVDGVTAGDNEA